MIPISVNFLGKTGVYPKENISVEGFNYFVYAGIPCLIEKISPTAGFIEDRRLSEDMFLAAIIFTKSHFPVYGFKPPYKESRGSIIFSSGDDWSIEQIIAKAKDIIDEKINVPILHRTFDYEKIKKTRSKAVYLDMFHQKKVAFKKHLIGMKYGYEFSDFPLKEAEVIALYKKFIKCPRYIQIALHYFLNAGLLILSGFIEDAGINLKLSMDAIIQDFMEHFSIFDKKIAIEKMRKVLNMPESHMDFLDELQHARNTFLAHIDKDMYTDDQSINDPDAYCFEHYETIHLLISEYLIFDLSRE